MKRLLITTLFVLSLGILYAQQNASDNALRTISVEGKAEKELTPDIVYFSISLKEYKIENNTKVNISELEKQLVKAVRKADIAEEDLVVENIYGYNYNWKNENKDFLVRKRYELKITEPAKIDKVLSAIDPKGIEFARVTKYTHSKIEELNQELQIEALKNARAKAKALLASLDEELGKVVQIVENGRGYQPIYYQSEGRMMTMAMNESAQVSFKDIKLEANIQVVFSIK